jgi:hypothetical protein
VDQLFVCLAGAVAAVLLLPRVLAARPLLLLLLHLRAPAVVGCL